MSGTDSLRQILGRRADPYEGADAQSGRRFVALLCALSGLLTIAFMGLSPPTEALGQAGWVLGALVAGASFAAAQRLIAARSDAGFDHMLGLAYAGVAATALLCWLDGGSAETPYRALFLLWLGSGVGVHPPRRSLPYLVVLLAAAALPLVTEPGRDGAVQVASDSLLYMTLGVVLMALIAWVRGQRVALATIERSARERAEEAVRRVQGLEAVADAALAHLPFDELLGELLERVAQVLAVETAAILLHDEARACLRLRAVRGRSEAFPRSGTVPLGEGSLAGRVFAEGGPVIVDDVDEAPDLSPVARRGGIRSLVGVPLLPDGGRAIGVLQVGTTEGRTFGPEEINVLQLAADRVAFAIDRARLNEQAHRIAETLQRSLLPSRIPSIPDITIATRYQPGALGTEVGGDLYDVVPYRDGRVGLAIGDVVGRGVEAASLMGQLRNALQAYAFEDDRPERVVERINRLFAHWDDDRIATFLYLLFDPKNATVSFASAGHLPPLVRSPDGETRFLEGGEFVPLGVLPFGAYRETSAEIEPGSTLLLYTDGLVEERGESIDEGLERLRRAAENGPAGPEALCDHVLATVPGARVHDDDIAVLAVQLAQVNAERLELRLPAEAKSLSLMRQSLERWLNALGASKDEIYEITVACGEACMNAVEHAYPPGDAVFVVDGSLEDGELELIVRDFGFWRPPRKNTDRGRGIGLMQRLMDAAQVSPGPGGTTVHLRRALKLAVPA